MTDKENTPNARPPSAKEKALAEALRQNLLKRKQQSRARDVAPPTDATGTNKTTQKEKEDI